MPSNPILFHMIAGAPGAQSWLSLIADARDRLWSVETLTRV
jgi:hypothetical protein